MHPRDGSSTAMVKSGSSLQRYESTIDDYDTPRASRLKTDETTEQAIRHIEATKSKPKGPRHQGSETNRYSQAPRSNEALLDAKDLLRRGETRGKGSSHRSREYDDAVTMGSNEEQTQRRLRYMMEKHRERSKERREKAMAEQNRGDRRKKEREDDQRRIIADKEQKARNERKARDERNVTDKREARHERNAAASTSTKRDIRRRSSFDDDYVQIQYPPSGRGLAFGSSASASKGYASSHRNSPAYRQGSQVNAPSTKKRPDDLPERGTIGGQHGRSSTVGDPVAKSPRKAHESRSSNLNGAYEGRGRGRATNTDSVPRVSSRDRREQVEADKRHEEQDKRWREEQRERRSMTGTSDVQPLGRTNAEHIPSPPKTTEERSRAHRAQPTQRHREEQKANLGQASSSTSEKHTDTLNMTTAEWEQLAGESRHTEPLSNISRGVRAGTTDWAGKMQAYARSQWELLADTAICTDTCLLSQTAKQGIDEYPETVEPLLLKDGQWTTLDDREWAITQLTSELRDRWLKGSDKDTVDLILYHMQVWASTHTEDPGRFNEKW